MELTEKEKAVYEHLKKRWPPGKVKLIWALYLEIKEGKKKVFSDLTMDDRMLYTILEEQELIQLSDFFIKNETTLTALP